MMSGSIPWNKIGKYISGNCSEKESREIDQWISEDPEHARIINNIEEIWGERPDRQEWDAEKGWEDFLKNLDNNTHLRLVEESSENDIHSIPRKKKSSSPRWFLKSRIAAAILFCVIALASLFIYERYNRPVSANDSALVMQEVVAEKGQRSQFKLSDGTKVWLNGGSKIEISAEFNSGIRKVYLEGEAFFDVASDPDRPFIIETRRSVTRVLGTKFDLQAYPNEDIRLVVEEGEVAFGGIEKKNKAKVTANQMALFSGNDPITVHNVEDLDRYMGWVKGKLVFKNTSFKEVVKRLERWYGIECSLADSSLEERTITGTFRKESVSEVINLITLTIGIDYKKKDGHITFIEKEHD